MRHNIEGLAKINIYNNSLAFILHVVSKIIQAFKKVSTGRGVMDKPMLITRQNVVTI